MVLPWFDYFVDVILRFWLRINIPMRSSYGDHCSAILQWCYFHLYCTLLFKKTKKFTKWYHCTVMCIIFSLLFVCPRVSFRPAKKTWWQSSRRHFRRWTGSSPPNGSGAEGHQVGDGCLSWEPRFIGKRGDSGWEICLAFFATILDGDFGEAASCCDWFIWQLQLVVSWNPIWNGC